MLSEVRDKKYNGILTWAPDRLSRNAGDLGSIVDLMDQKLLLDIRTYGQRFTNNPNEKFLLIPVITKELFDKVQNHLNDNFIPKTESKEFAFTKLIRCGYCGSSITADEKFKKLKDGGVNRHVYYFCTRGKNIDCKNPPLNEQSLITELINLVDRIDIDELGVKEKIEQEIARFNKFRIGVLGHKKESRNSEIDIKNYAKYLLTEGTIYEKRELLSHLKSQLTLKDKKVTLE